MTRVFPIALILVGLSVFSEAQAPPAAYDDPDAYAIFSTIIGNTWPVKVAKAHTLVIETQTKDYPDKFPICLKPDPSEEATLEPLVKAYEEANKQSWLLERKFKLSLDYVVVPSEQIDTFFKNDAIEEGWKDFYSKYPDSGGSIHMSAVGFNEDKTLALVYVGHRCGGLCGGGSYHLMKKAGNKWAEIPWKGISCSWDS